jgi:hypothetical protein
MHLLSSPSPGPSHCPLRFLPRRPPCYKIQLNTIHSLFSNPSKTILKYYSATLGVTRWFAEFQKVISEQFKSLKMEKNWERFAKVFDNRLMFANNTNYESFFLKKEKWVLPYYWLPNRTYHKSLVFYKLFFSTKSGQFGTIYFPWKILQIGWNLKSYISGAKLAKKMAIKKIKELHVNSSMYITTHTE